MSKYLQTDHEDPLVKNEQANIQKASKKKNYNLFNFQFIVMVSKGLYMQPGIHLTDMACLSFQDHL